MGMYDYHAVLTERFHLSYLRPSQEMIIARILENADDPAPSSSITSLPTGGGKSLCFLLPAVVLDRLTVLLYPLKSLMNDQAARLDEIGVPYSVLKGGMAPAEKERELGMLESGEKKILITNMEMLLILTRRRMLDFMIGRIELFVMDEAHTIVQWMDDFRPSYRELGNVLEYLRPHQALCFTATLDGDMRRRLAETLFRDTEPDEFVVSPDRDNVFYHRVMSLNKREDIRRILSPEKARPAVVFCHSRRECEEWCKTFQNVFPCAFYHAGLDQETKKRLETEFKKSDNGMIFATNAYGMGVDVSGVRTVIHTRLPRDPLSFLQESGRGGRDGLPFDSYVLIGPGEDGPMRDIFMGDRCIRTSLLTALDSPVESPMCTACSVCSGEPYVPAGMHEMRTALRRFPFLSRRMLTRFLMSPLAGRLRLKGWTEKEVSDALLSVKRMQTGRRP